MKSLNPPALTKADIAKARAAPVAWKSAVTEVASLATADGVTAMEIVWRFHLRFVSDVPDSDDGKARQVNTKVARLLMGEADRTRLARLHCPRGSWVGARLFAK